MKHLCQPNPHYDVGAESIVEEQQLVKIEC